MQPRRSQSLRHNTHPSLTHAAYRTISTPVPSCWLAQSSEIWRTIDFIGFKGEVEMPRLGAVSLLRTQSLRALPLSRLRRGRPSCRNPLLVHPATVAGDQDWRSRPRMVGCGAHRQPLSCRFRRSHDSHPGLREEPALRRGKPEPLRPAYTSLTKDTPPMELMTHLLRPRQANPFPRTDWVRRRWPRARGPPAGAASPGKTRFP
jgi:hypothetical protein